MANIAQVLKEEISRLAKKEVRQAIDTIRKDNIKTKKTLAELKRQIAVLEKTNKTLSKQAGVAKKAVAPKADEAADVKVRATGPMIMKFRKRHKLSQAAMAKLLGVTGQTIYQWEKKEGSLKLRSETKLALAKVRQMSAKEIREATAEEE